MRTTEKKDQALEARPRERHAITRAPAILQEDLRARGGPDDLPDEELPGKSEQASRREVEGRLTETLMTALMRERADGSTLRFCQRGAMRVSGIRDLREGHIDEGDGGRLPEDVQAERRDDDGRDIQASADDHDRLEDEEHDVGRDGAIPRVDEVKDAPKERAQNNAEHAEETEQTDVKPVRAWVSGNDLVKEAGAYEE